MFSDRIRQRAPARSDKWHLEEIVISIAGGRHWLWRAVDHNVFVLDVLIRLTDTSSRYKLQHISIRKG
ncbi:transposase-like protein [Bradyrhizobium sp. USDA 4501]